MSKPVFQFKKGDRVRDALADRGLGTVVDVKERHSGYPIVVLFDSGPEQYRDFHELEFVASPEEPMPNPENMQQRAGYYEEPFPGGDTALAAVVDTTINPEQKDMKYDAGKPRMDLLLSGCPMALEAVANILTFGAKKYAAHSWQSVERGEERYLAALLRHLTAHAKGEVNDPESGMPHLAHAACNAMFILELEQRNANL